MALARDRNTLMRTGRALITVPVGVVKIWNGSLVAVNSAGFLVPASDTAGLKVCGRAEQTVDNTAGSAGDKSCNVREGIFKWANGTSGEAIAVTGRLAVCYVVDDETVGAVGGSHNIRAGVVTEIDADGGIWVDVTLGQAGIVGEPGVGAAAATAGQPTIALGAEAAHHIDATIQLKDIAGVNLAAKAKATVWISATAGGVPAAAPPSSPTTFSTGTVLKIVTADVLFEIVSDATGVIVVRVTEATLKNFYVNVAIGDQIFSSAALAFAG